ncbi:MAG: hypothetical protein ACO3VO_00015 [Ilumatobacteraceae bacterium]
MAMNNKTLRPKASGFNPKAVANLEIWLDAADTTTITLNSGNVSQWNDKSGKGRNFVQSTATKQPAYSTTYFAKGAVHFDGSDDVLSNQTASNWVWSHREATWVVAYRLSDDTDTKQSGVPVIMGTVEQYNNASPVGFTWWVEDRNVSNNDRGQILVHNGSNDNVYSRTWNDDSMPEAVNSVIAMRYSLTDTKTSDLTLNGATRSAVNTSSPATATSTGNPTFGLSIGANSHNNYDGFRFGQYRIAEIMGWSRSLKDSELKAASKYLGKKWGVTIA